MEKQTLSNLIESVKKEFIDFDKIKNRCDFLIKKQSTTTYSKAPIIAAILVAALISFSQFVQHKKNMLAREEEQQTFDIDSIFEELILVESENLH